MATQSELVRVPPSSIHSFVTSIFQAAGVPPEHASLIADSLTLADLRGVDTHGVNRVPVYLQRVKAGVLDPSPQLSFVSKSPVMAVLDAKNTFGFVAANLAVSKAVEMAKIYGVGICAVKDSGHFGMAATYLLKAIENEMGAMVFTNASRSMPAWGSKEALLGTSPFAVGLPGKNGDHWTLDMSPSVVARGKIRKAARRGEPIPEGWALDAEGRHTTDAAAALNGGVVLPIGGPKGSGIAMMMDIFGGLLTGASFAGNVQDQYKVLDKKHGVGHWFMVFKPDMFLDSMDEYYDRMETLMKTVRESEKAAGVDRIYTPGEIEFIKEKENREKGVAFTKGEIDALHKTAAEWGCDAKLVS
ncbi:putative malate/L-lactate dehydrogenase [Rhizodiscina lignyota]|uniref:Malate/L-lactate dehydrogenase n=1 Tax=Rhizodiscina lignyota TaxID=1504668 RepID=A0A9P4IKF4_9PEZI|nr:putative malate/L-lactate dehydrogenase [Rhizodiscina lignyota]